MDGILFDLGVSTWQLEQADRGFSFNTEAVLDMRMDKNLTVTAKDLINGLREGELYELFTKLGEEHYARPISQAIVRARNIKPITRCNELAAIVLSVRRRGRLDRTHPATRVFQALRIAVNDELNALRTVLIEAVGLTTRGGRIAVISFHSLEDRCIKNIFKNHQDIKIVTKKPIVPSFEERKMNPRSRSAKLRCGERSPIVAKSFEGEKYAVSLKHTA